MIVINPARLSALNTSAELPTAEEAFPQPTAQTNSLTRYPILRNSSTMRNIVMQDVGNSGQARRNSSARSQPSPGSYGNIILVGNLSPEVLNAIAPVMESLGPVFPQELNRICLGNSNLSGSFGVTHIAEDDTVTIFIDQNTINAQGNQTNRSAQAALTFTHEVYLHAARDISSISKGGDLESESRQHRRIYNPPNTESNNYYQFILSVRDRLHPDLQQEFMRRYVNDLVVHAPNSDAIDEFIEEINEMHELD